MIASALTSYIRRKSRDAKHNSRMAKKAHEAGEFDRADELDRSNQKRKERISESIKMWRKIKDKMKEVE